MTGGPIPELARFAKLLGIPIGTEAVVGPSRAVARGEMELVQARQQVVQNWIGHLDETIDSTERLRQAVDELEGEFQSFIMRMAGTNAAVGTLTDAQRARATGRPGGFDFGGGAAFVPDQPSERQRLRMMGFSADEIDNMSRRERFQNLNPDLAGRGQQLAPFIKALGQGSPQRRIQGVVEAGIGAVNNQDFQESVAKSLNIGLDAAGALADVGFGLVGGLVTNLLGGMFGSDTQVSETNPLPVNVLKIKDERFDPFVLGQTREAVYSDRFSRRGEVGKPVKRRY